MSSQERQSVLVRFFDSFLQERNIKWVLGVGMLILLGSSLLFVTSHWDSYTPLWKHLVLLGYAAAIHFGGQWTYHRLGLRRTGTVLQGLMVFLIPVLFLALRWMPRESVTDFMIHAGLVGATFAFSLAASWRVFRHFLREPQPTFVFSYLTLALAGAIVPGLPAAWTPALALALWAVFVVGTVKVNRHVFWLTEEHRAPRIFGFFPVTLLGAQFLLLYLLHAAPYVSLEWLGFGCVLTALPVLLTSDAVARVFQQRTGDLVRPLPWAILVPLGVGLLLCAAGLALAGTSLLPPNRPYALVLTAAATAGLMALVARRTGKQAFVWATLLCATAAYNFSPAFFVDLARQLIADGAELVREERLPYAFYGLTYVPLLLGLIGIGAWLGGRANRSGEASLFAQPIQWYVFALSCVLLVASFTHAKALLPVGLLMTVLFALQARLFHTRYAVYPGIVAWFGAAYGIGPFATNVLGIDLPADTSLVCMSVAAGLLLWAGRWIDAWVVRVSGGSLLRSPHTPSAGDSMHSAVGSLETRAIPATQIASLIVSLDLAIFWLAAAFLGTSAVWPAGVVIALVLVLHSLRWLHPALSAITILFTQSLLLVSAIQAGLPPATIISLATLLLIGHWLLGYLLDWRSEARIAQAFRVANCWISRIGLGILFFAYLPLAIVDLLKPFVVLPPEAAALPQIAWPIRLLVVAWAFDLARRDRRGTAATLGYVGLLALVGATFLNLAGAASAEWLPVVWVLTALVGLCVSEILHAHQRRLQDAGAAEGDIARYRALEAPISYITLAVFGLIAVGSLLAFPLPLRVAGGLSLAGLVIFSVRRQQPSIRVPALILANWQVLGMVAHFFVPGLQSIFELTSATLLPMCLPVACAAALSLLLWQTFGRQTRTDFAFLHRVLLRGLILNAFVYTLTMPSLDPMSRVFAIAAVALIVVAELVGAARNGLEEQVWLAGVLALLGVAYLAQFRVLTFGRGITMFVILGAGLALWLAKEFAARRPSLSVFVRPFGYAAFAMPLATVAIGIYRHVALQPVWLGANSLALFLAGGFYFWRGIERPDKRLLILAGVILNIALVLLWRDLSWTDPQFFMIPIGISILALVQVLKREIPERFHDPLRYLGALVILVSPTFHIVGGSWLHIFTLMLAAVAVVLLAIGLRVRALLYMGSLFLLADLVAMLVRGSIDDPNVLWISGLLLGAALLTLGAICERNRETLLQRMRLLADALKAWD